MHLNNNLFAVGPADHDIPCMKPSSFIPGAIAAALMFASPASAQIIPPGGSLYNPPLPAPPPPPKIAPPVIPQMDAPAHQNYAPAPRPSFGDRVTKCLDDAAAGGLGPNDRAAYSRGCANQ
jgi:hypothetical protein